MTDISKLHTYLKTMAYEQDLNKPVDLQGGHNPFITISRETGAGGHSLAAALLKLMAKHGTKSLSGWHVLDQEICEKVAAEPGLKVSLHRLLSEE